MLRDKQEGDAVLGVFVAPYSPGVMGTVCGLLDEHGYDWAIEGRHDDGGMTVYVQAELREQIEAHIRADFLFNGT